MYERCLTEAERVLAAHKEVVVSVKTVWHEVVKHSKPQRFEVPSIADFTTMLEADARFEFLPVHQSVVETVDLSRDDHDLEELELESLGFFGEDRVKLRKVSLAGGLEAGETEHETEDDFSLSLQPTSVFSRVMTGKAHRNVRGKTKTSSKRRSHNGISLSSRKHPFRKRFRKSR